MKLLAFIACTLISINSYGQHFKRPKVELVPKEDYMDEYQASQISKVDLLNALNSLGVRVFNCRLLPRFTKTYKLTVDVDEYVNGKMIGTRSVSPDEDNVYYFWEKNKQYADYISKINLIARDADSVCILSVDVMGNTTSGIKLKKTRKEATILSVEKVQCNQLEAGRQIPMLVYSSSWYDKKAEIERSCGAVLCRITKLQLRNYLLIHLIIL